MILWINCLLAVTFLHIVLQTRTQITVGIRELSYESSAPVRSCNEHGQYRIRRCHSGLGALKSTKT